jgi:FKBP-type peptidyl-prolyl cis-trans isomerase
LPVSETESMPRTRLRLTIGGMLILVALIAVGFAYLRPRHTQVEDVKVGTGPAVKSGDLVTVHYVGTLPGGKEFDSSRPRGQPFTVPVGAGRVIRGWDIGLIGMQVGGVRRLVIPPEEGYGAKGVPPVIPPNATLRFEVELLQVAPATSGSPSAPPAPTG